MRSWKRGYHSGLLPLRHRGFTFGVELIPPRRPSLTSSFADAVALVSPHRPAYYTLPMKAPYFAASGRSGLQSAVDHVQQAGGRVILTVTTTMSADEDNGAAATCEGVRRILQDFLVVRGGEALLLLRGDDAVRRNGERESAAVRERQGGFQDSVQLLQFATSEARVLTEAPVSLFSSGYPQGHPMDRVWGRDSHASLAFLDKLAGGMNDLSADVAVAQPPRGWNAACVEVRKLLYQVELALSLREVSSSLPRDAAQRGVETLVRKKILQHGVRGVITQTLTDAAEFIAYVDDTHRELRRAGAGALVEAVTFFPGILAPLTAQEYTRLLLITKTIPSAVVQQGLRAYRDGLRAAAAAAPQLGTSDERRVETLMDAKAVLERTFHATLEEETMALCRTVFSAGHRCLHFSVFRNSNLPSLLQLLDRLRGEEGDGGTASSAMPSPPLFSLL
ncbi:hypothetical protein TraAM80_01805 [Trypanosoma rangeli]|uniref:Methylenetetrahydrofolate reductase (NAD(P)H) n=1 Tax=Trypanosoma rangeli TaxID=5698 RepID=A0A3R7MYE1_TRYRA|nr:uncharacterized protein TraAM80_01805 [Trypanosoma rangeli]RNF09966.1 hypothetical protein TraAM80_01805 [Trypanosoma rangeli]|eukprot:RNF09966.1 hypothetical protein TraAM80_01805 [Trypanosoma rangeli]